MWRAALAGVAALSATAHADTRAWRAAQKVLPAGLQYVIAGRAVRGMPQVHAALAGELRTICHLDPDRAVDSFALGVRDDDRGVVVVTLAGVSRARLEACATELGKHAHVPAMRWLGPDTFAVATDPDDRDLLTAMTSGGLAKDAELERMIGGAGHDHDVWGVARIHTQIEELGVTVNTAYGTLDVAHGDATAEVHLVLGSRTQAVAAALKATSALALARQSGQIPATYQALVGSLVVVARGDELVVTAHTTTRALGPIVAKLTAGG